MIKLTEKQIGDYFHRSYTATDGLWFMKVEEKYGFDKALEIDNEVWKVLPKIQARMLKTMLNVENGTDALFECLRAKLTLESFNYKAERLGTGFRITISECPWHNLMVKSGREKLSEKVGTLICNTEYSVFGYEFGKDIFFQLETQICKSSQCCILNFHR